MAASPLSIPDDTEVVPPNIQKQINRPLYLSIFPGNATPPIHFIHSPAAGLRSISGRPPSTMSPKKAAPCGTTFGVK